jgi:hypothetical protein
MSFNKTYGNGGSWWNGVESHTCIFLDDFDGYAPVAEFLQMLDGYGHTKPWPTKGGFTAMPKVFHVIITSNEEPGNWWKGLQPFRVDAVRRRINTIDYFRAGMPDAECQAIEDRIVADVTTNNPMFDVDYALGPAQEDVLNNRP